MPNSFSVEDFGVAVNAKYDRFGCGPRARVRYVAASSSSSPAAAFAPSACFSRAAASPPCDECASSMMTAYRLSPSPAPVILSSTYGYSCSVEMMIFDVESASASASCAESTSIFFTTPGVWSNWKMVRCSCRSSTTRSVITMTLWNTAWLSSPNRFDSRCASHAIVLDFPDPAECWIR